MKNLLKQVQNINSQYNLWNSGDTIVVGVSGGPDSMCLLDVLVKIAKKINLTIVVAHVNYGLRGKDSKNDQTLVEKVAQNYGISCETLVSNVKIKQNEHAWRNIRYDFFKKVADKYKAEKIAVAHTKNDQTETLLLNLLRGSGLSGLSAMQISSKNNVIRPLLMAEREDVLDYCKENEIEFNIDHTNESTDFTRNKIRLELLPKLGKEYNPQIIEVLASTAALIADDYAFLKESIDVFWEVSGENALKFSARTFEDRHISEQRTALRLMIMFLKNNLLDIESNFIEELRKAIISTKNKHQKVNKKDLNLLKKGDTVEFMKLTDNVT